MHTNMYEIPWYEFCLMCFNKCLRYQRGRSISEHRGVCLVALKSSMQTAADFLYL